MITLTKERIGNKIITVGFDQVGTTRIPRVYVFASRSLVDGKTYFYAVPNTSVRKYLDAQKAAIYGKQGTDYHKTPSIAQLNKVVSKYL